MQYRAPAVALVAAVRLDDAVACTSVLTSTTPAQRREAAETLRRALVLLELADRCEEVGIPPLSLELMGLMAREANAHRPPE